MATKKDEQEPTNQKNPGCIALGIVSVISVCLTLLIPFVVSQISSTINSISTKDNKMIFIITLIGVLVAIFACLLATILWYLRPEIVSNKLKNLFISIPAQVPIAKPKTPQKASYFVSYHKSDSHLARKEVIKPLEKEGRKKDFSIIHWSWSRRTKYSQEMARADRKAEFTLTILTPRYLKELEHDHAWMQEFQTRNQSPGKGVAILITECERGPDLESIEIIDLTIDDTPADRVRKLLTSIPGALESNPPPIPGTLKTDLPSSHNFEYPNNILPGRYPFFTGREQTLKNIYDTFDKDERKGSVRPQAITGMNGMGKTGIAVEYAHRYASYYRVILWIDASICNDLPSSCKKISSLLKKPENVIAEKQETSAEAPESTSVKPAQEPNDVSPTPDSIKKFLEKHERWLLVLDKCENLALVKDLISPEKGIIPPNGKGHILLTTRLRGISSDVHPVPIDKGLEPEEGALFLLRRSGKIGMDASLDAASLKDQKEAEEISKSFDGFPLGLAHAGAYVGESEESLSGFHLLYKNQIKELFDESSAGLDFSKSESGFSSEGFKTITTTWSITIRKLKEEKPEPEKEKPIGPIAAELLRFCAFLSDDAVPEEIIKNAPDPGPNLKGVTNSITLNKAVGELIKYSLINRSDGTLRVHPVLQAVIREGMIYEGTTDEEIKELAERAIKAVNKVLPDIDFANWQHCPGNISCALTCIEHINKQRREQILSCASTCIKYIKKWDLKSLPLSLDDMRLLYVTGHYHLVYGNYIEAKRLLKQSLKIHKEVSDEKKYPSLAKRHYILAEAYRMQGKFAKADKHLQIAAGIANLSETDRAVILNNLGRIYEEWGDWDEQKRVEHYSTAEKNYEKVLETRKRNYEQALKMRTSLLEECRLDRAVIWNDLAGIHLKQTKNDNAQEKQKKFNEAMTKYFRAWETFKEILGPGHPLTVQCRANLAALCIVGGHITGDKRSCIMLYQGKQYIVDPERDYQDALKVSKEFLGDNHPQVAARLANLAELYRMQDRKDKSEEYYRESVDIIYELAFKHPRHAYVMLGYADLLDSDRSKEPQVASLRRDARERLNKHKTGGAKPPEPQNEPQDRAGKNKSHLVIREG